jgi:hypothetical protein
MVQRVRLGGPQGVKRPYAPGPGPSHVEEPVAQALDHIARALSAIDHNVEVMTANVVAMTKLLAKGR